MIRNNKGFVLWFTGFSQSGKTTTADAVYEALKEKGIFVERLDGDVMRDHLKIDLGFSKKGRDANIKIAGFLAKMLANNGVAVVASFITPYKEQRRSLRKEINNFIEIFCSCPLSVCEKRDQKGLYKKARDGEIKNFTGISDPYEEPENSQVIIETNKESTTDCVKKIVDYLEDNDFI